MRLSNPLITVAPDRYCSLCDSLWRLFTSRNLPDERGVRAAMEAKCTKAKQMGAIGGMADLEPKRVVGRFLKAVETGDIATIEALQAPDCSWWIIGHGAMSRAEYTDAVKSMLLSAHKRTVSIVGMIAEGDSVATEVRSEVHFGARVYRNEYHDLFVVREGQIVHGREYFDTAAVAAFFGAATPAS